MNSQPSVLHLHDLPEARATLSPAEFRNQLRGYMLDHPGVTLRRVAETLDVTRQRASIMVGSLNRSTCCRADRLAPERERAAAGMTFLAERVAAGESAGPVARELSISLSMAMRLGFRVKEVRPPHGTWERAREKIGVDGEVVQLGCNCWRCRRVAGLAVPRRSRTTMAQKAEVEDWLAWVDPDDGCGLSQAEIGALVGVGQMAVSRVSQAAGPDFAATAGGTE
jgi:hypothetical protein